jgi:hypothetical protein
VNIYGFIVGIDRYDQDPDWDTAGPCAGAIAIAQWLLDIKTPPENIFVFLRTKDQTLDPRIRDLKKSKVVVTEDATHEVLNRFWRKDLPAGKPADSRLLVYWSGHGYASSDDTRVLIAPDFTADALNDHVFNATAFLVHLRSERYARFTQQIFLADVCGSRTDIRLELNRNVPDKVVDGILQTTYFATPAGDYATVDTVGVFTAATLSVLKPLGTWPDYEKFADAMHLGFKDEKQPAYRIAGRDAREDFGELAVGKAPTSKGSGIADTVYTMLAKPRLSDAAFRPHYVRTVNDLGMPELFKAQGLHDMVGELARTGTLASVDRATPGLIQFLARVRAEPELTADIDTWLKANAGDQGYVLENIRQKLEEESGVKVLVVDVITKRGRLTGYELSLRTNDLKPLAGQTRKREETDFEKLCPSIVEDMHQLDIGESDLEIHVFVDAPLFGREFHSLKLGADTLGERYVVILRCRERAYTQNPRYRKDWREYVDALRPMKPNTVRCLPVPSAPDLLPAEKGICYTSFVVAPGEDSHEKLLMLRTLLQLGVPYLLWLHRLPSPDAIERMNKRLGEMLAQLNTLDEFPRTFTKQRLQGNALARDATLLWDDPVFNPFHSNKGVTLK